MATIYTIGHSTRTLDEFIALLQAHEIALLVDIRSYPASRRMSWFQGPQYPPFMTDEEGRRNEALETTLPRAGIEYAWMRSLGGRRGKSRDDSPNTAWRSPAFRNYADYMLTEDFRRGAAELIGLAESKRTCVMCAEGQVYYHCHRMLLSDYLAAKGHTVLHISSKAAAKPHRMTAEARVENGELTYPGEPALF
ncbi:MAG: DUF488 family protein [Terriglobales bacterium]